MYRAMIQNLVKSIRTGKEFALRSCFRMRAVASLETGPNENLKGSFRFESTIPRVSFSVVQISPVPIISNPLTSQLLSLANASILAAPKMGFLTMNQTRKLLFLTEDSGSLSRTPIVGVWTALEVAPHSTSSAHLYHPFVWAACTRFLFTDCIGQRVSVDDHTFLLVIVVHETGASLLLGPVNSIAGSCGGILRDVL
jgi:SCL-interrupting locus protein